MKRMRNPRPVIAGLVVTCLAVFTGGACADTLVFAKNPEDILNAAKGFGSANLDKTSKGNPVLVGRIDGVKYTIMFQGCTDGKDCRNIMFRAGWSDVEVPLDKINAWNAAAFFGKAYLDSDADPVLEMPVTMKYGMPSDNLENVFEWWVTVLSGFKKDVLDKK